MAGQSVDWERPSGPGPLHFVSEAVTGSEQIEERVVIQTRFSLSIDTRRRFRLGLMIRAKTERRSHPVQCTRVSGERADPASTLYLWGLLKFPSRWDDELGLVLPLEGGELKMGSLESLKIFCFFYSLSANDSRNW